MLDCEQPVSRVVCWYSLYVNFCNSEIMFLISVVVLAFVNIVVVMIALFVVIVVGTLIIIIIMNYCRCW